jgi:hypothetical protein
MPSPYEESNGVYIYSKNPNVYAVCRVAFWALGWMHVSSPLELENRRATTSLPLPLSLSPYHSLYKIKKHIRNKKTELIYF